MVNFDRLRQQKSRPIATDPIEIFRRLPKPPGVDDLWSSQADALKGWYSRRNEQDLVIKLNTGGGKTLVGLLIAQSLLNEFKGPVLYLCATSQLQVQTLAKAKEYGIPAVGYATGGGDLPGAFLGGKAVMIATYHALFNGLTKFHISGSSDDPIRPQGIILDDAHTAFSAMREIFTLSITRESHVDLYEGITTLFRADFDVQGKQGTFDDVIGGHDDSVLEVPYWSWRNRADEVRQQLSPLAQTSFRFVWPLVRDHFDLCHALISKNELSLTPFCPLVQMFPSYSECPRRIYMSATVADDSSIIRTFDADFASISKPVAPSSLAGVGERMILVPELMRLKSGDVEQLVKRLTVTVAKDHGAVILVPSASRSTGWEDIATVVIKGQVEEAVAALMDGTHGPYVFINRYDGIDLPGESCRLLVLAGLPRGSNAYDLFRATTLEGSSLINVTLAQRIEQGMGRGTRGGSDYCVVIVLGKDVVGWISQANNLKLLTAPTRVQLNLGIEVSKEISTEQALIETVNKCINRSPDWTKYHAEALVDSTAAPVLDVVSLRVADVERKAFSCAEQGDYERAVAVIERFVQDEPRLDPKIRGWLLDMAARSAHQWGNTEKQNELQQRAYANNRHLSRSLSGANYLILSPPTKQAERIADFVDGFALRKGAVISFDQIAAQLVSTATANQFEEAVKKLGEILGFSAERPEKEYGVGPDVLWLFEKDTAWIIEAKSKKDPKNALTKGEHGQLLQAVEWFNAKYPHYAFTRVIIHPNEEASKSVTVGETKCMTLTQLNVVIGNLRVLLDEMSSTPVPRATLVTRCEKRLKELNLTPEKLTTSHLSVFRNVNDEGKK